MPRYTFEVSAGPTVLIREAGVELADRNAVWTHIAGLAFATGEAGARVTVRDGRLNLGFHPSLGKALVSAISISR